MLNITTAQIQAAFYFPFQKENPQSLDLGGPVDLSEYDHEEVLKNIFLKPFTQCFETYDFWHPVDINHNMLHTYSQDMREKSCLDANTALDIAAHLMDVSLHPNIKDGDVFILDGLDVLFKANPVRALAICKVENKATFIDTQENGDIGFKKGIGQQKLDKACLVLFTDPTPTLLLIDNAGKETEYWKNDFVKVKLKNDEVNSTNQAISMAKTFISQQIPHEYEVEKSDQIDLLNKSSEYFKSNDTYKQAEFESAVFGGDEAVTESYRNYSAACAQEMEIQPLEEFEISKKAVQKHGKVFKSVLKLDKNFHIYIHGDKSLIRKGVDDEGRKYYQVFYEEES